MFAAQHVAGYDVIGGDGRNRISSAVHSTTLPPLRGRKARHKPDRARFLHEGERSRQAGRLNARVRRPDPLAAAAACAPWRSARASRPVDRPARPAPRMAVRPGGFLDRAVASPHKTLAARALAGPRASFWPFAKGIGEAKSAEHSLTGKSRSEGERAGRTIERFGRKG